MSRSRPTVAMMMYPGMTMLDLIGPQEALSALADVHLVASNLERMVSDSGVPFHATTTIANAPSDVDVLFVPGGNGSVDAMGNTEIVDYLADLGTRARFVTSVCTGSLVLGAAGLLQGYKATSHWACRHLLPLFGAEPSDDRVVVDRNRITGGGITAGIDFALTLLAEMLAVRTPQRPPSCAWNTTLLRPSTTDRRPPQTNPPWRPRASASNHSINKSRRRCQADDGNPTGGVTLAGVRRREQDEHGEVLLDDGEAVRTSAPTKTTLPLPTATRWPSTSSVALPVTTM